MRILYVSSHFPPDISALAARAHDLTTRWVRAGHEVHVLCGLPCHPTGVLPPEYQGKLSVDEMVDGVHVHRRWVLPAANSGTLKRSVSYASFALSAIASARTVPEPDVTLTTSPQFLAGLSGALVGKLRAAPLVVEIRDLWPASMVDLGVLSETSPLTRTLEGLERRLYRSADALVVVSEPFRSHVAQHAPAVAERIHTITNGVDVERFNPSVDGQAFRDAHGLTGTLAVYGGTHGMAHGLETVIDAAQLAPEVTFVLVGEGARKADLQQRAQGLDNVRFLPGQPREAMPSIYAASDICLVPLRDLEVFRTVIPSKMFEIWATGRPIVLGVRGHAASMVRDAQGGVVIEPEDAQAMADAVRSLAADPKRRQALGDSGRAHVLEHYNRDVLAERYLEVMAQAVAHHETAPMLRRALRRVRTLI